MCVCMYVCRAVFIFSKIFGVKSNSKKWKKVTIELVLKKGSLIVNSRMKFHFSVLDSTWKILESNVRFKS